MLGTLSSQFGPPLKSSIFGHFEGMMIIELVANRARLTVTNRVHLPEARARRLQDLNEEGRHVLEVRAWSLIAIALELRACWSECS